MEEKNQAQRLKESALENIDKHNITPLPDNYRLWFEYAKGAIDALNKEIDQLVTSQKTINDSACDELFHQFIASNDQQHLDKVRQSMTKMLKVMVENIEQWDTSTIQFCHSLQHCAERLNKQPSISEINTIICEITEEAKKAQSAGTLVHESLHTLTTEIETLRKDVDRLGQEALTDPLTKLANRRSLDHSLEHFAKESINSNTPMSILMADIDNFKKVNDSFGHNVGDKVIRFVATIIKRCVRGNDFIARFGGEEYAIILPDTSLENAQNVAENIRRTVSARQLTLGSADKVLGRITLSIGVSEYVPDEALEDLIERADKAMYEAKSQGRNKVTCH